MADFEGLPDAEEDPLTVFNRQLEEKLAAKRAKEAAAEETAAAAAKEELEKWNKQREMKVAAKKESNKEEEANTIETMNAAIEAGQPWERVMTLIDASAEASDSGKADVSRMRKLFIQLKNDKPAAASSAAADK